MTTQQQNRSSHSNDKSDSSSNKDDMKGNMNQQSGSGSGSGGGAVGEGYEAATTGKVIDPEHDGRLKENRSEGMTKGTTNHTSQSPNQGRDDSGSINATDKDVAEA